MTEVDVAGGQSERVKIERELAEVQEVANTITAAVRGHVAARHVFDWLGVLRQAKDSYGGLISRGELPECKVCTTYSAALTAAELATADLKLSLEMDEP